MTISTIFCFPWICALSAILLFAVTSRCGICGHTLSHNILHVLEDECLTHFFGNVNESKIFKYMYLCTTLCDSPTSPVQSMKTAKREESKIIISSKEINIYICVSRGIASCE